MPSESASCETTLKDVEVLSMQREALHALRAGELEHAVQKYSNALTLCTELHGKSSERTVAIVERLGFVLNKLGRTDEAFELLQRALVDRPVADASALSRVALLGELSGLQTGRGDLDSARELNGEADDLMIHVRAVSREQVVSGMTSGIRNEEEEFSSGIEPHGGNVYIHEHKLNDTEAITTLEGNMDTVAADGVEPECLPLPIGTRVEVRARNEDELFYGAVVTAYDSELDTYQVTYMDGDGSDVEDGLRLASMLIGDRRRIVVKNEILEVLDGHVLFRNEVRNIRLLRFNDEPDVFQSGVMLHDIQQDPDNSATNATFDHSLVPFVLNQALALSVPCLAYSRFGNLPTPVTEGKEGSTSQSTNAFELGSLRACILGAGGGALPSSLLTLCPTISIDVIDLSETVLDVAKTYFGLGQVFVNISTSGGTGDTSSSNVEKGSTFGVTGTQVGAHESRDDRTDMGRMKPRLAVYAADAVQFLVDSAESTPHMYDIVVIDVAVSGGGESESDVEKGGESKSTHQVLRLVMDLPPEMMVDEAFLQGPLQRALAMDGLVAVNVLADRDTLLTLLARFERAFQSVSVLATDPNYVFFLSKTSPAHDAEICSDRVTGTGTSDAQLGQEQLQKKNTAGEPEEGEVDKPVAGVVSGRSLNMWAERLGMATATMDALGLVERTEEYISDKVVLGLMDPNTFRELLLDERVGIV